MNTVRRPVGAAGASPGDADGDEGDAQARTRARRGRLGIGATDPRCGFVVDAGTTVAVREHSAGEIVDVELRGAAVDLVE